MTRRVQRGFRPDLLAERRLEMNMTVAELARLSKIRPATIRDWEQGRTAPEITTLKQVARTLHKPLTAFVTVPRHQRTLSDLRVRRGLTPPVLAREAGVSTTFYAEVERGDKQPSPHLVEQLAQALRVRPATVQQAWQRTQRRPPGTPA